MAGLQPTDEIYSPKLQMGYALDVELYVDWGEFHPLSRATEGCMGEQASLEFDLTLDDVLLHKLVQAY